MIVAAYVLLFYILVHYLLSQGFSAELMIASYFANVFPAIKASPLQLVSSLPFKHNNHLNVSIYFYFFIIFRGTCLKTCLLFLFENLWSGMKVSEKNLEKSSPCKTFLPNYNWMVSNAKVAG